MALLDSAADDLETMLQDTEDFAEEVTIATQFTSATGAGVFDLTYQEVNVTTQQKVQSKTPRVALYAPAWEQTGVLGESITGTSAANWTFTIRGVNYNTKTVHPDGTGWVLIYLTRAKP